MSLLYDKKELASGISITMASDIDNIDRVCHDVETLLRATGLETLLFDIQLGIREALANAVKHGSQNDPRKQIFFQINIDKSQVVIKVKDEGAGFVRLDQQEYEGETLLCCGRGVQIMHQYLDKVTYNKPGNEVELIKVIANSRKIGETS